jgi:hypothetical protein
MSTRSAPGVESARRNTNARLARGSSAPLRLQLLPQWITLPAEGVEACPYVTRETEAGSERVS